MIRPAKHTIGLLVGRLVLIAVFTFTFALAQPIGLVRAEPASTDAAPAAETPADPEPITTADPGVALDDLELMLEPMTRAEVEAKAKAWFAMLRAKVSEISVAELAVRRKNREIAQLAKEKEAAQELAKATEELKSKQTGPEATAEEKAAAAERLSKAQKELAGTVDTAEKEAAQDKEKAAAAEKQAEAKKAEATKFAAAPYERTPATGDVTDVAVAAARQKAAENGEVQEIESDAEKEASAEEAVKSLVETTPDPATDIAPISGDDTASSALAERTAQRAEQLAFKVDEASETKSGVKVALVDLSTQLTSERTVLADRLKLVLDKWELKGGDPTEYRQYIASLAGFKIDVSDRTATLARIKA